MRLFYRLWTVSRLQFSKRSPMISIEISDPTLRRAADENQTGEWCFTITTINGGQVSPEEVFCRSGAWKEARLKAEEHARTCGCRDGMDSVLLLIKFQS
jgi:hypothetical protein